jgi:hypothetical protein
MRLALLIISLALFPVGTRASPVVPVLDSSEVVVRTIREKDLAGYRAREEFNYRETLRDVSAWDRFWNWFWSRMDRLMSNKDVKRGVDVLLGILAVALMIYAIYRYAGMDRRNVFRGAQRSDIPFNPAEQDVRKMDLPSAIARAEQEGQYRLALRLLYLNSLRQMADRDLIRYAVSKTNHDYARELAGGPFAASFSRITLLYEFGWYGEFPVDRDLYERIREVFTEHQKSFQ